MTTELSEQMLDSITLGSWNHERTTGELNSFINRRLGQIGPVDTVDFQNTSDEQIDSSEALLAQ